MRGSRAGKGTGKGGTPLIAHSDVNGKAVALLLVLALAAGSFHFALGVPPRVAAPRQGVVNALEAEGGRLHALPPDGSLDSRVKGLDYLVPLGGKEAQGEVVSLTRLREMGLLRGYSLPPRQLAFKPDGGYLILPPSLPPDGPRDVAVISSGNSRKKRVALTFDTSDVAEPTAARAVIDELTRLRAPATIFVCGAWCYKNPGILRAAVDRGFEIANHSYSHPMFTTLTNEQIARELDRTAEAVREVTGAEISAYFRPPYGDMDARVQLVSASRGYAVVTWDRDTLDWEPGTIQAEIRDRATVGVEGGEIVLMHTLGKYTASSLIEIVSNLRAGGFELTTLSGVLQPE